MKRTLIATAIALAFGASSAVWANPTNKAKNAGDQTATANSSQSISVSSDGGYGDGGKGGRANGSSDGGYGDGGKGKADASASNSQSPFDDSSSGDQSATGGSATGTGGSGTGGAGGTGARTGGAGGSGTGGSGGGVGAAQANEFSSAFANSSGNTATHNWTEINTKVIAVSKLSATVTGNTVYGLGNIAHDAYGGAGGSAINDAGTFNASNTMSNALNNAAGISMSAMNTGHASLIQQSANVQANLTIR